MSKLKMYPKYKDSGVEWLGEVPEHWELTRLGTKFFERKEKVSDKEFAPLSVTKKGIVPQLDSAAKTNDGDNRKLVKSGDFVINSRSDRKGSSGVSAFDGSVSLINIVLEPYDFNSKFCNYLLKSNGFVEEFYRNGHGIVADLWTTRYWDMKLIIINIPPKQEQTKIANYLDQKTAQIDKAISLKEQMIEKLKERRQILINDAVTKGLDPNVKMKDSRVEWIGEIPEGWEVKKFRFLFNFSKGLNITKENLQEEGIPCVNYGEIHSKYSFELDPEKHPVKCVSEEYLETAQKSLLRKGDFIFADTSEDVEAAGSFAYLKSEVPTFAGYHTIITRLKKPMVNRFIAYFLNSDAFRNQVRQKVKGVKVYSITNAILKETLICLPQLEEQQGIVKYLDIETKKIDQVIFFQQKQIEKLKEYKATLIDSVVTGKFLVKGESDAY